MIRQYNSKWILIVGFGTVILIVAVLMLFRVFSVLDTEKNVKEIYSHKNQNHLLGEMRDAARLRALLLYRMSILVDEFERDAVYIQFKEQAGRFISARIKLSVMEHQMGEEKQIWETVRPVIASGQAAQLEAAELYLLGEDDAANKIMLEQVMPIQNLVTLALSKIIDIQRQAAEKHFKYSLNRFSYLYLSAIAMGGVVIFLILAIAVVVVRRTVKAEVSLSEARDEAQQATKQKSLFLANMSHEIRTPLAAVIGYAQTLLEDDVSEKEAQHSIQRIISNGQHLAQLVNDILDFSKLEANLLDIETIAVSTMDLMLDIKFLMIDMVKAKNLEFKLDLEFPLPAEIETDPTRLRQIILNLCSNAIKFTDRGWITIRVSYEQDQQCLLIIVCDTGIGISKTQQQGLFESFTQADVSTTRKFGGTGLGLSISQQLAQLLGGDITCKSALKRGSEFTVTISAKLSPGAKLIHGFDEQKKTVDSDSVSNVPVLSGNILLAEDGKDNQAIITLLVRRTGAVLDIVENGKQVLEALSHRTYDLILMDMQMPQMDGADALKHIRQSGNNTPVVMLTANAMLSDRQRCKALGANEFLTKPIDNRRFYQTLSDFLSSPKENAPLVQQNHDGAYDSDLEDIRIRFLAELPGRMANIKQHFGVSDFHKAGFEIHHLKGLGTSLGFPEITRLGREIETLMANKQYALAQEMLLEMDSYCYCVNEKESVKYTANS